MITKFRLLPALALLSLSISASGCDDSALRAKNQEINRCYHATVKAGTSLEDRKNVFARKEELKSGCPNYSVALDALPSDSVAVDGFPAGFYPQGESYRKEMGVSRKQYEESFAKNYSDYEATISSTAPTKCLGSSFYGCTKRLSQTLTVTTDTTGAFISKPDCISGICNDFSSARVTVQPPMSYDDIVDSRRMELSLMSNSAAKVTNKIVLTFNTQQVASLVAGSSKEELYGSNLYEVFSAISDQCKALDQERFYSDLSRLFLAKQASKNHLFADGFSASAINSWSSNRSAKICGMSVRTGGFVGISADWDSASRNSRMYLEIKP